MASIIEGYNYDIFISYRQKDNKHDGWVTEFVDNLKGELESTFKEEISVYFDINPHDGLLETHDVDESLKDKLKCLIFIPVISRTYCDPKSFAWEHEFKAFIEQASHDQYGLKVKFPNGNVANRVLPVRIHDLDITDIKEYESVFGGVLRGIEFIYKESGIDKPLTADDDEKKNLNNTKYRIQIIKVAHAIKEIIQGMKAEPDTLIKGKPHFKESMDDDKNEDIRKAVISKGIISQKSKKWMIILLSVALCILCVFIIFKIINPSKRSNDIAKLEKSIGVLPFKLLSDELDKQYLADGMMDAITLHLSKIKDLRVMPRTSVEQYRGTTKTTQQIGKELGVEYLLEGSFQKFGDNIRLIIQLIKAREESHAWANEYTYKWSEVFSLQSQVAKTIASELKAVVTPEEMQLIEKIPSTSLTAYDFYQRGNEELQKYWSDNNNRQALQSAEKLYKKALKYDTTFAKAYISLSRVYWSKNYLKEYFSRNFLDSVLILANIALSFDDHLDEAYATKGEYYMVNGQNDEALINFDKTLKINPNYYSAYYEIGKILRTVKYDYVNVIDNYNKALTLCHGKDRPGLLRALGDAYLEIGFIDKAKYYYEEAFALDNNKQQHQYNLIQIEYYSENLEEAVKLSENAMEIDSTFSAVLFMYISTTGHNNEEYILAKKQFEQYKKTNSLTSINFISTAHWIGYAFWQAGKKREAEYCFNQIIKSWGEGLKLGRNMSNDVYYGLAETYAFLGDKVKAYQYLDELNKSIFYDLGYLIGFKHSQLFAGIRIEERFQKFLRDMEAKYQAEHERVRKWLEEEGNL
jgi:TolB-like protein